MFQGRQLFKGVACPKGNSCDVLNCIFGHAELETSSKSSNSFFQGSVVWPRSTDQASTKDKEAVTPEENLQTKDINIGNHALSSSASTSSKNKHRLDGSDREIEPKRIKLNNGVPETTASTSVPQVLSSGSPQQDNGTVQTLAVMHKNAPSTMNISSSSSPSSTRQSSTVKEASTLKSHTKKESLNPRLVKSHPAPHTTRLGFLQLLHKEYEKLNQILVKSKETRIRSAYLAPDKLIKIALDEEEQIATQKPNIYKNTIGHAIAKLRKMSTTPADVAEFMRRLSIRGHRPVMPVRTTQDPEFTQDPALTPVLERKLLGRLILDDEVARTHLTFVQEAPTEEQLENSRKVLELSKGFEECARCSTRFKIDPETLEVHPRSVCRFHIGKMNYNARQGAVGVYSCCQQNADSHPCYQHDTHVFKTDDRNRMATVVNWEITPDNSIINPKLAIALDCEMGFTTKGFELIRISAIDWPTSTKMMDILVEPHGRILDINTKFSGVTLDMMKNAPLLPSDWHQATVRGQYEDAQIVEHPPISGRNTLFKAPNLEFARAALWSMISPSTPLIGHDLRNDMNAMRMIHPTIVDTLAVYPHRIGLPSKLPLRLLVRDFLGQNIQQPNQQGHDPTEDARGAGDLVRCKVKELWKLMKGDGWTCDIEKGEFIPALASNLDRVMVPIRYMRRPEPMWWKNEKTEEK